MFEFEDFNVYAVHPNAEPGVLRGFHGTLAERITYTESQIGVTFIDKDLLRLALVHRSWLNEHDDGVDAASASNERLEFLGDAVLGMICAEWVFQHYPTLAEGELTSRRVALVRTETGEVRAGMDAVDRKLAEKGVAAPALAFGFCVGVVCMMSYRLLERAGWPKLDINDTFVVMMFGWAFGMIRGARRYS